MLPKWIPVLLTIIILLFATTFIVLSGKLKMTPGYLDYRKSFTRQIAEETNVTTPEPLAVKEKDDENGKDFCYSLKWSKEKLPLTLLASFPGSGNTWTRHLIQMATGIYTGSVYCDEALRDKGFPGECFHNQSVIVAKTHIPQLDHWKVQQFDAKVEKVILLLRNASNAMRSLLNWENGGHLGHAYGMSGPGWDSHVIEVKNSWRDFNLFWLREFDGPVLVVRYEDMMADHEEQIRRICKFLDFPLKKVRLKCLLENSEGSFRRKHDKKEFEAEIYSKSMKAEIEKVNKLVNDEIKKMTKPKS